MENTYQQQQLDIYTSAFEYAEQHHGDIEIMKAYMKGAEQFLSGGQVEKVEAISIHYGEDGKPDGIRICALGEDFGLKLKDEPCGRVDFYEAQKYNPPTKKQFLICAACLDEVNEKLVEAGGDPLEGLLWSGSEYDGGNSWMFYATNGTLGNNYKMFSYGVRGSLAFKS